VLGTRLRVRVPTGNDVGMGHPSKLSPRIAARIVEATREGATRAAAAAAGPVAPSTMYAWIRLGRRELDGPHARFVEQLDAADAECERRLIAEWRGQCPSDWRAAAEFLARRFPDRWRRQPTAIEVAGSVEIGALTDDERAERLLDTIDAYVASQHDDRVGNGGEDSEAAGRAHSDAYRRDDNRPRALMTAETPMPHCGASR
jgi:hypothetical protein